MVFIKELDKNVFPCYLPPEDDELFTSWIYRLSANHFVKSITFFENYFGNKTPFWNRDIDSLKPQNLVNKILDHTPLLEFEVSSLFLKSYEGYAFNTLSHKGYTTNILPLGINHRERSRFGLLYCPKCLAKKAFYKKKWRLVSSLFCTDCDCNLLDRCYNCNFPIVFFRNGIKTKSNISTPESTPIYNCYNCGVDLRKAPTRIISSLEKDYQLFIDQSILNGFNNITPYSFLFFRGFFLLAKRLTSATKKNRLRDIVQRNFEIQIELNNNQVRFWSINERTRIFMLVYSIIQNYPKTLALLFDQSQVTKYQIVNDRNDIPYWLEKLFIY
jgi:hypothetical protein